MRDLISTVPLLFSMVAACSDRPGLQCEQNANCDLAGGGVCLDPGTGNRWCAYPDSTCTDGLRFSDVQVGDGVSGMCVASKPGDEVPGGATPLGWALAFGSSGRDVFNDVALTPTGDVVAVGSFETSASFGGPSLMSKGERDAVVVRLDGAGKHVWSRAFGGAGTDEIAAVAIDQAGNIYVVGSFVDSIDVDGAALTSLGRNDAFVAKLNGDTGGRIWAFRFGALDAGFELERDITVSPDGAKLAISGQFFGTANFGGTDITHSAAGDAFVAVYSAADGSHIWSRGFGGTGIDDAMGVAFDGSEGIIIAGSYVAPASFGGSQPLNGNTNVLGDIFVARYAASNGAYVWANGYGSGGTDIAYKVSVVAGSAYVVGSFSPTPGMNISLGGAPLVSAGGTDGFVAKYDAATGSHILSRAIGGQSEDRAVNLAVTDQIWVIASFSGTTQIGNANYTSAGISDAAFGSFNLSSGAIGKSGAFGGPDVDVGNALAASSTALCTVGWFAGPTTVVYGNPLAGAGMTDAFIGCRAP